MIYLIKRLALFALICLTVNLADSKTAFSKHEQHAIYARTSGNLLNSKASYIICDDVETCPGRKLCRKCRLEHGHMAENSQLSTCNITFQGQMTDYFTNHVLSDDKMLLVWYDDSFKNTEYLLRYTVVQFPDCTTAEVTVAFDDKKTLAKAVKRYEESIIMNEDGTYDVFFENPKFCDKQVCRLTIDSQGKIIKGPTASYNPIDNPITVVMEVTPVNNSILIAELGKDSKKTRISLITPEGQKILKEFYTNSWGNNGFSIYQGTIRGCENKNIAEITCETFDANGQSLSKNALDVDDLTFDQIIIANLPNGQFILSTESRDGNHIKLTKFDANSKNLGTVQLPEFTCNEDSMIRLKEIYEENKQICISHMCYDHGHVDLSKDCFDDSEFK